MLVIHDDKICISCFDSGIRPQFEAALANEAEYPVVCGGKELKLKHYRYCFTRAFRHAWEAKLKEYDISPRKRLYCQGKVQSSSGSGNQEICGKFLTKKTKKKVVGTCRACDWKSCARCASSFIADGSTHICSAAPAEPEADTLAGLERGVDYQKCPKCDVAVELRDGCKYMTYKLDRCRTHFCFLCGEKATRESGHWSVGRDCPLYHRKGAPNAQYDGAAEPVDLLVLAVVMGVRDEAEHDLLIGPNGEVDVPEEVQWRRVDRQQLRDINSQLVGEIDAWPPEGVPPKEAQARLVPLHAMFAWVDILYKAAFAYTLHFEPDEGRREALLRVLDQLGPVMIGRKLATPVEVRNRFPMVEEIFERIVAAAARLPARFAPAAVASLIGEAAGLRKFWWD